MRTNRALLLSIACKTTHSARHEFLRFTHIVTSLLWTMQSSIRFYSSESNCSFNSLLISTIRHCTIETFHGLAITRLHYRHTAYLVQTSIIKTIFNDIASPRRSPHSLALAPVVLLVWIICYIYGGTKNMT